MDIRLGDFDDPQVQELLQLHINGMHASSPPGTCHVLDVSGLKVPEILFYTAWENGELLGMGAIKQFGSRSAEIKSMRTASAHVRKGVAEKILLHLLSIAKSRGYSRVSLETGTSRDFDAAIKLYEKHGFVKGCVFEGYEATPHNQFLHLDLRD